MGQAVTSRGSGRNGFDFRGSSYHRTSRCLGYVFRSRGTLIRYSRMIFRNFLRVCCVIRVRRFRGRLFLCFRTLRSHGRRAGFLTSLTSVSDALQGPRTADFSFGGVAG
jgi:hypothetical protein